MQHCVGQCYEGGKCECVQAIMKEQELHTVSIHRHAHCQLLNSRYPIDAYVLLFLFWCNLLLPLLLPGGRPHVILQRVVDDGEG